MELMLELTPRERSKIPERLLRKIQRLEIGKEYIFEHQRKGEFKAVFKGREPTSVDDKQDDFVLSCLIDTTKETGNPRLARVPKARETLTNIRPSLILNIDTPPPYVPPVSQTIATAPPLEAAATVTNTVGSRLEKVFKKIFSRKSNNKGE
jgi:hypothetical protein